MRLYPLGTALVAVTAFAAAPAAATATAVLALSCNGGRDGGRSAQDWVDVASFGAQGDGVTDDTAAFVKAAATKKNLLIRKPRAHYKLTGKVRVYASIVGEGMPEIRMYGATGKESHSMLEVIDHGGPGLVISGLHLDGQWDGVSIAGEWSHNIVVKGSKNVTIENNILERAYGDNILLGGEWNPNPSENIVIRNNRMRGPRRCNVALIFAKNVKIDGNHLHKASDHVTSIDLEPNPFSAGYTAYETVWNVQITNNHFDVPRQVAVLLQQPTWGQTPDGIAGGDVVIRENTGRAKKFLQQVGKWTRVTESNNF